jgi:hypothetical protein
MSPEISLLSDLHASLTGRLPKHCRICNKGAQFSKMLRQRLIVEREGLWFITEEGKKRLDASGEVLPCVVKEFIFDNFPPGVNVQQWRSRIQIDLDTDDNVENLRRFLPEPDIRFSPGAMENGPNELAVFATGEMQDKSYAQHLPIVLLSPWEEETSKRDTVSEWLMDFICRNRSKLARLLAPVFT